MQMGGDSAGKVCVSRGAPARLEPGVHRALPKRPPDAHHGAGVRQLAPLRWVAALAVLCAGTCLVIEAVADQQQWNFQARDRMCGMDVY